MMQEIYQRGPIACGIAVTQEMEDYTGGIFEDLTGDMNVTHEISIVGFGEENGTPYWIIRNSWGTHWGIVFKGCLNTEMSWRRLTFKRCSNLLS